jgi:hypothetical protein
MLYMNQRNGAAQMVGVLQNAIANGSLIVVDWAWPKAYPFHDQPLTQASCLWQSKGRFTWLGINDLDEIFLPGGNERVCDVLNRYENESSSFGSIACCNQWLAGSPRVSGLFQCASECNKPPRRQKNIVRVDNVDYFCNHRIMLGLPERRLNGLEMVNGHWGSIKDHVTMKSCDRVKPFKSSVERWIQELW